MKLFIFAFCICGILVNSGFSATEDNSHYRLNTDIEPIDYTIDVTPYFNDTINANQSFTFDGNVKITLKTKKNDIKIIILHTNGLNITHHTLSKKITFFPTFPWDGQRIGIDKIEHNETTTKCSIFLKEALVSNQAYDLTLEYKGSLRTDMHGFYRSSYKEGDVTKWLASTHMEPVHARKVFPCFDEPQFKATFNVIINRPTDFQPSISNTVIESTTVIYKGGQRFIREQFRKTPRMSTYLVAFIVSEFECLENSAKNFFVCSRPKALDQAKYSFEVGQKTLAKFDELFDYKYNTEISKMSMAAIPDFAAGAMENWGLLTYRETTLLYDRDVSTAMAQQRVAAVVAHEQTHMWFGDLVTCDWWSHTWLNEGFARFFQYFGTALVEDTWGLKQQFVIEQVHSVFGADSLEDSKALSHEVYTPDEIAERFGSISYNKGASVIRMFEHALGNTTFIAALRNYLKKNALKTAVPEKLYAAFQEQVGEDLNVTDVMGSWVTQPGYPVVYVDVSSDRKSAVISQHRFLRNNANHQDKTLWKIPITFATDKENNDFTITKFTALLSNQSQRIVFNETTEWSIFNVQQTGYYRVNYDEKTWSIIGDILHNSHAKVHVLNRAQIIDDSLNLARANQLKYPRALHTILYLQNETDYIPWLAAFNNFDFILGRLKEDEAPVFREFILNLLKNVYEYLGFEQKTNDTRLDIYNRNNVLKYACQFGHEQCIADARAEFDKLLRNYKIPVNLVPVVYCSVVSKGTDKEWNFLWDKFKGENVAAEQVTILNALGCTKQEKLIENYFDLILSDNIRLQDKHAALASTLIQQQNVNLVLNFVINKHKEISKIFESETEVPTMLSQILSKSTTNEQITQIQKFAEMNNLESNPTIKTALTNAKFNLKWAEENVPVIIEFVKQQNETSSTAAHTMSCIALVFLVVISIFYN